MNQYQQQFGQPYQQPYQMFYQPPSMPVQRPQLFGRVIGSADEAITANEVPMDSAAYFPVQGGREIIAKAWNSDGGITTVRYTAAVEEPASGNDSPTLADIMSQLDDIQDMLKQAQKPAARKTTAKKEADGD